MNKQNRKGRLCTTCQKELSGRIDKVFCGEKCKNKHHAEARKLIQDIAEKQNKRVKRNLVVLLGIFGNRSKKIKVNKNLLFDLGFDCDAFVSKENQGETKWFVIREFKFKLIGDGLVEIYRVKSKPALCGVFLRRWLVNCPEKLKMKFVRFRDGVVRYFERILYFTEKELTALPL